MFGSTAPGYRSASLFEILAAQLRTLQSVSTASCPDRSPLTSRSRWRCPSCGIELVGTAGQAADGTAGRASCPMSAKVTSSDSEPSA